MQRTRTTVVRMMACALTTRPHRPGYLPFTPGARAAVTPRPFVAQTSSPPAHRMRLLRVYFAQAISPWIVCMEGFRQPHRIARVLQARISFYLVQIGPETGENAAIECGELEASMSLPSNPTLMPRPSAEGRTGLSISRTMGLGGLIVWRSTMTHDGGGALTTGG